MDTITLSYRHPGEIDADTPAEVREIACSQLADLAPKLRELVEQTGRQIRNAVLDEIFVEVKGDIDEASRRITAWENGDDKAAVDRLHSLGALLEKAALEVAELPQ